MKAEDELRVIRVIAQATLRAAGYDIGLAIERTQSTINTHPDNVIIGHFKKILDELEAIIVEQALLGEE